MKTLCFRAEIDGFREYMLVKQYKVRGSGFNDVRGMLINGRNKGVAAPVIGHEGETAKTPYHVFHVKQGKRYHISFKYFKSSLTLFLIGQHFSKGGKKLPKKFRIIDISWALIGYNVSQSWEFFNYA